MSNTSCIARSLYTPTAAQHEPDKRHEDLQELEKHFLPRRVLTIEEIHCVRGRPVLRLWPLVMLWLPKR